MGWNGSSDQEIDNYTVKQSDFDIHEDNEHLRREDVKSSQGIPSNIVRENVFFNKIGFEVGTFFNGEKKVYSFTPKKQ